MLEMGRIFIVILEGAALLGFVGRASAELQFVGVFLTKLFVKILF